MGVTKGDARSSYSIAQMDTLKGGLYRPHIAPVVFHGFRV